MGGYPSSLQDSRTKFQRHLQIKLNRDDYFKGYNTGSFEFQKVKETIEDKVVLSLKQRKYL
jgi:hypothetical protein